MGSGIRAKLKRIVPETRSFLARFNLADALDRYRHRRNGGIALPIPPKNLRTLVGPDPRVEGFLAQGRRTTEDIRKALAAVNRPLESFRSVLDFGCGCGRQMRWLADLPRSCRLHGSDIAAAAIRWNRRHLHFAEFETNSFYPPLPCPDAKFDLIYAISVFTHLGEKDQRLWLAELHRVALPGAIVIITTQGQYGMEGFRKGLLPGSAEFLARLNGHGDLSNEGVIFEPYEPEGAYGLAFHDPEYIRREWGRTFRILTLIPNGVDGWQDVVVMEKAD